MIYIEVAEKSKKEAIYMTILSTLAANAAMFACEINFNDAEAHAGTSFVPFLGFMVFLIGLVFCFIHNGDNFVMLFHCVSTDGFIDSSPAVQFI
jgi:hypothetical protein